MIVYFVKCHLTFKAQHIMKLKNICFAYRQSSMANLNGMVAINILNGCVKP